MFSPQVDKYRDRAKEVWVVYRSVQKCTIQVYRVVRSCDHRDLSRNSLLTMQVCPMKRLKRLRRNLMRLRKSLMKLEELNLKSITELSDLVTMEICPVKILWPRRFVQWRNYYKWWNRWNCQMMKLPLLKLWSERNKVSLNTPSKSLSLNCQVFYIEDW